MESHSQYHANSGNIVNFKAVHHIHLTRLFCILVFITTAFGMFAQGPVHVQVVTDDGGTFFKENRKFRIKDEYDNDAKASRALNDLILKLYSQGYVTAGIDSTHNSPTLKTAWLHIGPRYEWVELRPGNADQAMLNQVGYKEKLYRNKYFRYDEMETLLNEIVTYSENNGYPFAVVKLDSVKITENMVSASINLKRNQLITYDTLALHGTDNTRKSFLYSYLGIKKGKLYDESQVQKITKRLSELQFAQEERPFQVVFVGDKARINLYLTNKKASQFDILIGLLPNNEITGRVLFTGDVNLNLVSPFGLGEVIGLNWKKLQAGTQDLNINVAYPYIVGLPIGVDGKFHLYKSDTLYIDVDYQLGLQYQFAGRNYVRAFVHNKLTNVLNVDSNAIFNTRQLPYVMDLRSNLYGLEYYLEKYDYRFNPLDGYALTLSAGAGTRKIKKNNTISNLKDPESTGGTFDYLYDSIKLNAVQYRLGYSLDKFWPLGKRTTIRTATTGAALISKDIFQNELYRIGGNKLLRGFDEESIFASLYNVVTAEFRFKLQKNSYFNVFADGAYVEDRTRGQYTNDFPYGFGIGISYETKAGVFGVSYALGGRKDDPVNFRNGKIHFGYVNYF
jgi:outer membrane protein assembly factor BamA